MLHDAVKIDQPREQFRQIFTEHVMTV